jgi:glycosyltransferase involved in cell wall biosynthesis
MQTQLSKILKISVITPIYNGEPYIKAHYESICSSLVNYNFEVIYCDNNSPDRSFDIIKILSKNDLRVIAIKCYKKGVSSARNVALDKASGDILIFLDIDDRVLMGGFSEQINIAFNGVASYSLSLMDSSNPWLYPIWNTSGKLNFWLNFGNQGALSSFVTPNNPIRFDESLQSSEDWLYIVSVRKFLRREVALVKRVNRMYDTVTGYSSGLYDDLIKANHIRAFSSFYDISDDESRLLFDLIYGKVINLSAFAVLMKIYIFQNCTHSLFFLNLIRLKCLQYITSRYRILIRTKSDVS